MIGKRYALLPAVLLLCAATLRAQDIRVIGGGQNGSTVRENGSAATENGTWLTDENGQATDGQGTTVPEGYELVDSLVYRPTAAVDTSLAGRSVWSVLPSRANGDAASVYVRRSDAMDAAFDYQMETNPARSISGYRIRIYFDNSQTSRGESEEILKRFSDRYHGIPVYRTYANPYFKVTAGDFRTRSEAMALLVKLRNEFPRALLVREKINWPAADANFTYTVDTVKVLRPILQDGVTDESGSDTGGGPIEHNTPGQAGR